MAEQGSDNDSTTVENIGGLGDNLDTLLSSTSMADDSVPSLGVEESGLYYKKQMEGWKELAENRGFKIERLEKDVDERDKHIARLNVKIGAEPAENKEQLQKENAELKTDLENAMKQKDDLQKNLDAHVKEGAKLKADLKNALEQKKKPKKEIEGAAIALKATRHQDRLWKYGAVIFSILSAILLGVILTIAPCKCLVEVEQMKIEINGLQILKEGLEANNSKLMTENTKISSKINNLNIKIDSLTGEKKDLEEEKRDLLQEKSGFLEERRGLMQKVDSLDDEITRLNKKTGQLEKETDEYQTRLSACQIRCDNNTEIVTQDDLSPFKLAEQYRSLYEQDYTLAVDEISEKYGPPNVRETVKLFLDILKAAHSLAANYTQHHIKAMRESITSLQLEIPPGVKQNEETTVFVNSTLSNMDWTDFYEMRQKCAWRMRESLADELGHVLARQFQVEESSRPKMVKYIKTCIEFCWKSHMIPQPVFIDFYEPEDTVEFDYESFKPFMHVTGNYMDYIVWPPLYEKSGGPMLSKGVAEKKD